MIFKNFDEMISHVKSKPVAKKMAVAVAGDGHTLQAVMKAKEEGIIDPILVGDKKIILEELLNLNCVCAEENIYDFADDKEACEKSVSLVRNGKADFLMKGKVDTKVILKAVVNKESGLGTGGIMSHFTIFDVPTYHKLLTVVDGGMIPYPDLSQKKAIIENSVSTLCKMGYENPKVGVLSCAEKVNLKMPETIEGDELKKMNQSGEIKNCIVEGPISFDCAWSKEVAEFKGYNSEVSGEADILVVPNIHAGNILGKALIFAANAKMAGFVVGAKCPIVLTSRGSTPEEKYLSIVVSAAATK